MSHHVERLLFDKVVEDLVESCRIEAEAPGCGILLEANGLSRCVATVS